MEDLEVTESAFVHDLRPLQVYSKKEARGSPACIG